MSISQPWHNLLKHQGRPFTFAAGIRNPVEKGYYCPFHSHPFAEIVYHPSGRGITTISGEPVRFEEFGAAIYAPGELHDQLVEQNGEDLCVQVLVPHTARLRAGLYVSQIHDSWILEEIQQLCRPRVEGDAVARHILNLRATAVLLALIQRASERSDRAASPLSLRRVVAAERFIAQNFSTIGSLNEVAEHVQVSPDHLRHLYKAIRGKPLIRHLNEVRIARAKLLLVNSPLPQKQIAILCGFKDEYYFSAVFRKLAHVSPGTFRQK